MKKSPMLLFSFWYFWFHIENRFRLQVGFNMKKVTKGNVTIKLWDLGGQPRFRSMWERYCRAVAAIVYVFCSRSIFYIWLLSYVYFYFSFWFSIRTFFQEFNWPFLLSLLVRYWIYTSPFFNFKFLSLRVQITNNKVL